MATMTETEIYEGALTLISKDAHYSMGTNPISKDPEYDLFLTHLQKAIIHLSSINDKQTPH